MPLEENVEKPPLPPPIMLPVPPPKGLLLLDPCIPNPDMVMRKGCQRGKKWQTRHAACGMMDHTLSQRPKRPRCFWCCAVAAATRMGFRRLISIRACDINYPNPSGDKFTVLEWFGNVPSLGPTGLTAISKQGGALVAPQPLVHSKDSSFVLRAACKTRTGRSRDFPTHGVVLAENKKG